MTSVGVKIDNSVTRQSGPYYFKIQEELHHLTGALLSHGDHPLPMHKSIFLIQQSSSMLGDSITETLILW